jgi:drug/metabolite transporter (DMT)-like permease
MASGMAFAVGSLSLRWASARGLDTYRVMWANGTGATVVLTLVVAGLTWRHGWGSLAIGSAWLWVFAAGIMNGVTNMALTQALRYAPVGGVTAIQAGAVPLTGLVAEVAFGEGGGLVAIAASLAAIVGITLAARDPTPLVPNQERELSS